MVITKIRVHSLLLELRLRGVIVGLNLVLMIQLLENCNALILSLESVVNLLRP